MKAKKMKQRRWLLTTGDIKEFVYAETPFAAWDTLRDRSKFDFGLVTSAEPDEDGNPYHVRTSLLMFRWGRDDDAEQFIALGLTKGMPDTTAEDRAAAIRTA